MSNKYDYLKEQYPEFISVNQFYKICHIAKRSAVYLLKNGIVPYTDTGKKTWKYKIRLCDVITYLTMREQEGSKIPRGKISNGNKKKIRTKRADTHENFMRYVKPNEVMLVRQFFEQTYPDCSDLLSSYQAAEITGLGVNVIRRKIRIGELQAISNNRTYFIPKACLFDFFATSGFLSVTSQSESFMSNLAAFIEWKEHRQQL